MQQSGEPSADTKKEGMKNANFTDDKEIKKAGSIRGGDNASLSDEDLDEDEIQQAGGNNKGGIVPGASGRDSQADGHKSLNEGM